MKIRVCPNCVAKTSAPESYFNVAKARKKINAKLNQAQTALRRANFPASGWIRCRHCRQFRASLSLT